MLRDTLSILIFSIFLSVLLTNSADAQSWSTQGSSGCSDQYGSFDAFIPGMRGHGSCNRGGFVPGTTVIRVSNTNATGAGSLDAAGNAGCPKVILFDVAGLINRGGRILMNECDNWSIVGASAPGNITATGATIDSVVETKGSNWTIDHMTIAAGDTSVQPGGTGNRDSIAFGNNGSSPQSDGIVLNNTLIWGADETSQCYPNPGRDQSNILHWQNVIGVPVGGAGVHIIQNTCPFNASIRNFYAHSHERTPLVRADGYFHSNNFTANTRYRSMQIAPCTSPYSPVDNLLRFSVINNFSVKGPQSFDSQLYLERPGGSGCTNTLQVYEDGNRVMEDDNTIVDCSNHACAGNIDAFDAGDFVASSITSIYPTGYVPETISSSAAGLLAFANQVTSFAGARPNNRLAYVQTIINEGVNMVDGTGSEGGYPNNTTTVSLEGGVAVITPPSASYNPTAGTDNPCGENMPTGAAADAIQSSGLTRLHEWVIGCFYDNVMPAGYREDRLQNYGAPTGGGSGPPGPPPPPPPPAAQPNPPVIVDVS